ncbi:MAG: precorrin-2 C(20)-methyltransferase [Thermodesulfobacteriota bacterium]
MSGETAGTKGPGTLYGIGVGPGGEGMITVKGAQVLGRVDLIFTASSTKNQHSLAVEIAAPHIPPATPVRVLGFPMTKDPEALEKAWEENARLVIRELQQGKDAAFLTVGDCLTYSTFGYVVRQVKRLAPHIRICSIPGITAFQAAAARLNQPLVEGEESMLLVSGVGGGDTFRKMGSKPENVVFLKAYRNAGDIVDALEENGMGAGSVAVTSCGRADESIETDIRNLRARRPNYWTLILCKKPGHEEN